MRSETERQARSSFSTQKRTAKQRGIDWMFTFEEWWLGGRLIAAGLIAGLAWANS
jgi:hypothetical protein